MIKGYNIAELPHICDTSAGINSLLIMVAMIFVIITIYEFIVLLINENKRKRLQEIKELLDRGPEVLIKSYLQK